MKIEKKQDLGPIPIKAWNILTALEEMAKMEMDKKIEMILTQLLLWQDKDVPLEEKVEWGKREILRVREEKS